MTKVADVIAAIDAEGSSSWQIADALAAIDEVDEKGKPITLQVIADRIWDERGVEWSPAALGKYRSTAVAFPVGTRVPTVSFRGHMELRAHPKKLLSWKPKKDGDVLTVERAKALRGGGSSTSKPKPDEWKQKVDRALGTIGNLAEHDPLWTIDALEQTVATIRRQYSKASRRDLRAV